MVSTLQAGIFSGSVWEIVGGSSAFGIIILLLLTVMSVISWVVILNRWRTYKKAEADNNQFLKIFRRSKKLAESVGQAKFFSRSPLSNIFMAGYVELASLYESKNVGGTMQETKHSLDADDFEIIEMGMEKTVTEQITILERQVIFLATTANAAPFMGLLGTVVGIMDSFWSIGERGSASLAVVAPGIAEALLATIVGLAAAIPAVIAFNWANNKLKNFSDLNNIFVLEFIAKAKKEAR